MILRAMVVARVSKLRVRVQNSCWRVECSCRVGVLSKNVNLSAK